MRTTDDDLFGAGSDRPGDPLACASVRDRLPLWALGLLEESEQATIDAHLAGCEDCRTEGELIVRLQRAVPEPPESLLAGVLARSRQGRDESSWANWRSWAVPSAVAAALALALGVGLTGDDGSGGDAVWAVALEPEPATWYGDEWMVAGEPVPEALPDDVLRSLLEEIDQ